MAALIPLGLLVSGCTDSPDDRAAQQDLSPPPSTSSQQPGTNSSGAGSAGAQHLGAGPLLPGTYQFSVLVRPGVASPGALIDVPSGFEGHAEDGGLGPADWYVVSPDGDAFLGLWTVGEVERDACLRPRDDHVTPGPSVEDLTAALIAQRSTRASAPEPVDLAGYQGLYIELAGPPDMSRCDRDPGLWGAPGERGIYSDNQIDRLWILDRDGQRLVVDAAHGPTSTASERDKLTSMVESLDLGSGS